MADQDDRSSLGIPPSSDEENMMAERGEDGTTSLLDDEIQTSSSTPPAIGNGAVSNRYREIMREQAEDASDEGSADAVPKRAGSPVDSLMSGSVMSSPSSSILPSVASRPGLSSPSPSFRPFDRRFQSRISSSFIHSPRSSSPAFLAGHSRSASLNSGLLDRDDTDTPSPPWEVVRWTRLKKLNGQAFSEAGKRNFGTPTCIAVSASIVLGTSKGIILMFDYNQVLKTIIGPGTKAVESGAITAIAVSADHTTIAGGHANGSIFTWEANRASRPFLYIPHLDQAQLQTRTMDGHLPSVAVTHLGFLGTRHTALVSADNRGMAFSHLATRGTGSLGRTVKTTRILGRYPDAAPPTGKPLKPSTVLAFSPLPLGNTERATDTMGLTAMLTPYLLVIVSTTPVAQTQHKSARPKDVARHSAMTGCLAWFPAVKLKVPDPVTGSDISKVKLVYCWSNVLTVLDVDEIPAENKDKPPGLKFKARSRWKCEEAIVAVQWLSRSVLTVLTITQRLIVLEDRSLRMTEGFDLMNKFIYHADLFSKQLHNLVEQLDEDDTSMHGVVADAFYMSFKTYKGKIFLLGYNDVSIGSLSNWADRIIALMENGDYVGAIQLGTSYYTGDADKLTIGLPEDTGLRHSMVREKLMEIMRASLKYAFTQRQKDKSAADDGHLRELAEICFTASISVGDVDFLFEEMYEWYEDAGVEGIFFETMEPYILEKQITIVPPAVVKTTVTHYVTKGWESRLEEMVVHMETTTLDLDQITVLCKQHSLYDALIYVWNQALNDYITPLVDLLTLLVPLMSNGDYMSSGNMEDEIYGVNALKMFPYLSYTLTGRVYPTGEVMDDTVASKAKAEIYWFLFSGNSVTWPKGSDRRFLTRPDQHNEPSFPYLRLILKFDAPSFLSAVNEAFEDSFLNDSPEKQVNGGIKGDVPEEQIFGRTVDRQYIVSILLEIMNPSDFAAEDTIYLDMFIARNLPKFPQYLLFPGSTLTKVLTGLCNYPGADLAEDAQLSAEYLLSIYQPPDANTLIPMFKKAGFYRILKRQYKVDKQYGKLIQAYFEDPADRDAVFECIGDCLRPQSGLNRRQVQEVLDAIKNNARALLQTSPLEAAKALSAQPADVHQHVLHATEDSPGLQFFYLRTLLEPEKRDGEFPTNPDRELIERYVQFMCRYDPSHVSDYIGLVQSINLRLDALLPAMEETGVIDAAVVLMAREGQVNDAMDRLVKHLGALESAFVGILTGAQKNDSDGLQSGAEETLRALQKYVHVGIWLCQGHTKSSRKANGVQRRSKSATETLSPDEELWLNLIDAAVQTTRHLSTVIEALGNPQNGTATDETHDALDGLDKEKFLALLRSLVQHTFTALLTTTSSPVGAPAGGRLLTNAGSNLSFLRILRAFLARAAASSPNLADLRSVLASIFSAYAYEESILRLSNRLLERSLFVNVKEAVELRQRGWRPRGSTCEACGHRVWGPGVSGNVFEAWEEKQARDEEQKAERKSQIASGDKGKAGSSSDVSQTAGDSKGKGKAAPVASEPLAEGDSTTAEDGAGDPDTAVAKPREQPLGPLVVLACRHIYHQSCLDAYQARPDVEKKSRVETHAREYRCPIDG
ncbi:Vacuolar protein sorting-associated protein 8 -like protein [Colletotrichum tanaceti]|uniref:Vacuolar protein sorting-associated protein 8-like protein n=1 Tax=Colletotrichum tanaceti TaxID=1306861 RepID=A0A4U6XRH0_9PEZI|nr:Vacuolar protein sorting-associated protein 8 -like protein [Colletotrichum tanaceti]TKW58401.1 Vacuolar protein sorting-associated protein 8 -like protein [Colletotrichum tanaceti]